jgi:predicted kinase
LLIVVTGRPGSGKTQLAHRLARAVRCPAICRDEVKEGLVNTRGEVSESYEDLQKLAYDAFFATIELLLKRGVTIIAEAAFQHERWVQKLESLQQIAKIRMILCTIDPQLARARHIARGLADPERERFHGDRPVVEARAGRELPIGEYDAPRLDVPTLHVDTTDGYKPAFESIVFFAVAGNRD